MLVVEAATPALPSSGPHGMYVFCTGMSINGKPQRETWNSNAELVWRVMLDPERVAHGGQADSVVMGLPCHAHPIGGSQNEVPSDTGPREGQVTGNRVVDVERRQAQAAPPGADHAVRLGDWFYVTTSTDLYHFDFFKDTWAQLRAYGSRAASAEALVKLSTKEKTVWCELCAGQHRLLLVRVGTGPAAKFSVQSPGGALWAVTRGTAHRGEAHLLLVNHTSPSEFFVRVMEDLDTRPHVVPPLILFMLGFTLACGLFHAADVYFQTGLAPEDQHYSSLPHRPVTIRREKPSTLRRVVAPGRATSILR